MVKPQKPHTDKSHKSHKARLENKKNEKHSPPWEFWYHLTLVDNPSQFEVPYGVGILMSSYPHGHFKVCLKFHGGGNFDITLPFCTFPVNLKFPGGPNIEITLPLWTLRVNWSSMAVGILISSYPCGQSKSVWCSMVVRILISSCPCAHSLHGGGTFEIIFEFWYHLTLVDSRSVSISSSMGVTIVWGNFSCTVAQSGDRSCASRVAQA